MSLDLALTDEDIAFRDTVRCFLRDSIPEALSQKVLAGRRLNKEDFMIWHRILAAKGWVAPSWPLARGGTSWTALQKHLFEEECYAAGAPPVQPPGIKLAAPVIMRFGSAWQQDFFLPRIYHGIDFWCQGYSEPGAGSDLASLSTKAVLVGEHYVVNGQKTWTTLAHWADMMFTLVRTSSEGKRQEGITFLLIDMKSPGITVRPIVTLDAEHELNEVFLDDVRVPAAHRIGEEGKGWTYAKFLLGHERTSIAGVARSKRDLQQLKALAAGQQRGGRALSDDPLFALKIAQAEVSLMALEITVLRVISAETQKGPVGAEASMLKIQGTEIRQRLAELMVEAVGPQAMPFARDWLESVPGAASLVAPALAPVAAYHFNSRKASIYGGTNEVQKNIVAGAMIRS